MDTQYGVEVTNKFALNIDEEDDPFDILQQQEELNKQDKTSQKTKKAKQAKKNVLQPENKNKQSEQTVVKKEGNTVGY